MHFFGSRRWRRRLAGAAIALVLALLLGLGPLQRALLPWVMAAYPAGLFAIAPGVQAGPDQPVIVLTIDDGLSRRTDEILTLLARHQAQATFFLHTDSFQAPGAAATLARIQAAGHRVGHHMPVDEPSRRLPPEIFAEQFALADGVLRSQGLDPQYFRAAGGLYNREVMLPILRHHGYRERFVMASLLPWDTHLPWPRLYAHYLLSGIFPGAIVVFHDGEQRGPGRLNRTLISLELFLEGLDRRGYRAIALPDLLPHGS
ncbi:MAG: polysaccharide deacetylase family protein [Cyanobacteria bacterium]|nr:polysaccharide deacetylase family protein [Cyanobacteriota bacterium]